MGSAAGVPARALVADDTRWSRITLLEDGSATAMLHGEPTSHLRDFEHDLGDERADQSAAQATEERLAAIGMR